MNRRALDREDRKTFDRWIAGVAMFYAFVSVCLLFSVIRAAQVPGLREASANRALDRSVGAGQHR